MVSNCESRLLVAVPWTTQSGTSVLRATGEVVVVGDEGLVSRT